MGPKSARLQPRRQIGLMLGAQESHLKPIHRECSRLFHESDCLLADHAYRQEAPPAPTSAARRLTLLLSDRASELGRSATRPAPHPNLKCFGHCCKRKFSRELYMQFSVGD